MLNVYLTPTKKIPSIPLQSKMISLHSVTLQQFGKLLTVKRIPRQIAITGTCTLGVTDARHNSPLLTTCRYSMDRLL